MFQIPGSAYALLEANHAEKVAFASINLYENGFRLYCHKKKDNSYNSAKLLMRKNNTNVVNNKVLKIFSKTKI